MSATIHYKKRLHSRLRVETSYQQKGRWIHEQTDLRRRSFHKQRQLAVMTHFPVEHSKASQMNSGYCPGSDITNSLRMTIKQVGVR